MLSDSYQMYPSLIRYVWTAGCPVLRTTSCWQTVPVKRPHELFGFPLVLAVQLASVSHAVNIKMSISPSPAVQHHYRCSIYRSNSFALFTKFSNMKIFLNYETRCVCVLEASSFHVPPLQIRHSPSTETLSSMNVKTGFSCQTGNVHWVEGPLETLVPKWWRLLLKERSLGCRVPNGARMLSSCVRNSSETESCGK